MQNNTGLDKDYPGYSLSNTLPGSSRRCGLTCLNLGLILLLLCYACLAACDSDPNCSSKSLNSLCAATPKPTAGVHQPVQKPGAIQSAQGKARSKPEESQHISAVATANPTPTPITFLSDKEIVLAEVKHYEELVL